MTEVVFQVCRKRNKRLKKLKKSQLVGIIVALELRVNELEAENEIMKYMLHAAPQEEELFYPEQSEGE